MKSFEIIKVQNLLYVGMYLYQTNIISLVINSLCNDAIVCTNNELNFKHKSLPPENHMYIRPHHDTFHTNFFLLGFVSQAHNSPSTEIVSLLYLFTSGWRNKSWISYSLLIFAPSILPFRFRPSNFRLLRPKISYSALLFSTPFVKMTKVSVQNCQFYSL